MIMKGVLLSASGEITEVFPANGKDFVLNELQRMVEGPIEVIQLNRLEKDNVFHTKGMIDIRLSSAKTYLMVVNEEGKLAGKRFNPIATMIALATCSIKSDDWIVGDTIICLSEMIG